MKTMFVAHENNGKKKFQKPNILRRRRKVLPKSNISVTQESPGTKPLVTAAVPVSELQLESVSEVKCKLCPVIKAAQISPLNNTVDDSSVCELYQIDTDIDAQTCLASSSHIIDSSDVSQASINVEAFLNSDTTHEITQLDIDDELNGRLKQEWCLDFINNSQEIIIEDIDGSRLGSLRVAPGTLASSAAPVAPSQPEESTAEAAAPPMQNLTLEYLANSTMNFKCDSPDCNKRFRSEQKLNKHKLVHDKSPKVAKQTTIECPVKHLVLGVEKPCGVFCASKEELVKHLNETHNPEDAMYICSECGRRFFWASGLRAHGRAHCGGGAALACGWAGCGRQFRQPCRLREHMRAHTGDKPYPCRYPNCGWSFRTASKLVRHARRHTGERRHSCAACARAFRRREHLRDHVARAHAHKHACREQGCQKKFTNLEGLKVHMEKVHKQELIITEKAAVANDEGPATSLPDIRPDETFMVSLDSPAFGTEVLSEVEPVTLAGAELVAEAEAGSALAEEWRAARTHCTWPLAPRAPPAYCDANHEYVLEEDVQVELSEGSESNIYTIRSDLFLHGNVLNNEDSEQMPGVETSSLLVVPQTAEADLSLLDAHPTIDLMQEELMYTDSAVDESSFRVFLLSGEELS